MNTLFSPVRCNHHLRLTLFGQQVLLASDSPEIIEILAETFSSRFFAPFSDGRAWPFFCGVNGHAPYDMVMELPWDAAGELPPTMYGARPSSERSYTYDLFECSEDGVVPAGSFSYENSNDLSSRPTDCEIFAAYFQRRMLDRMLHQVRAYRLIHAGSLSYRGSGMLLMAPSKSGKSTLVLAGTLRGMQFLSDDHTAIDLDHEFIHPFPRALRLRQKSLDLIPGLSSLCSGKETDPTGETRYYFHPERWREDALGSAVPLTHIVRMKGFSKSPRITPANPANVAIGCAGADFFPEPAEIMKFAWRWTELIETVKCAHLEVGDPLETAEVLKAFLERD